MQIEIALNGKKNVLNVEPDEMLADALRKIGMLSIRQGCDTSCCGLCTVWVDESPVLSCTMLAFRARGKNITTIEGVQPEAEKFAGILAAEGAEQCGFCSPGFIMTVLAMKKELPSPTDEEIMHYLAGNLCRCTGYMGQMRAVKTYMEVKT
ncbi:MAG TPA: 2Fe-2S iron-sulfur cluster-binding protein [Negativicutes bacterium]|nr:2Fe-2S iron-sulfur cluster-binding protein [Negativicutes bacterium]